MESPITIGQQEAKEAQAPSIGYKTEIRMPEVHQQNKVSIFEIVIATERYGVLTLKALMGRRPEPVMTAGTMMIPNVAMCGSILQQVDTTIRYLYMHNYAPLSDILSDIDPDMAIDALREQIEDAVSNNSVSYRLVRDTDITENRSSICERQYRESASIMAAAIRTRMELAPPLPTSGVDGDDFETITREFVSPKLHDIKDEHVYDEIRTEVQEELRLQEGSS